MRSVLKDVLPLHMTEEHRWSEWHQSRSQTGERDPRDPRASDWVE